MRILLTIIGVPVLYVFICVIVNWIEDQVMSPYSFRLTLLGWIQELIILFIPVYVALVVYAFYLEKTKKDKLK